MRKENITKIKNMKHNRNELEDRYDEIKKQVQNKVNEYKHKTKFIQSTCNPYFCTIENKWKTKTTTYK